jgi:hypothetical protein
MSTFDIFKNSTSKVPQSDPQIVRVNMEEIEIGGRKSHLPAKHYEDRLTLGHVPNAGTAIGTK